MVLSILTSIPFQTMAATIQDTKVGASSAKESIVYKSNNDYIDVADFGNSDYVDLDSSEEIYYKVNIDSEIFSGSTVNLKINSIDSGTVSTSSISIGIPSGYYKLVQYVPIDLSDYSGKIELSIWLVLANGQKYYDDEPVKLNIYSKIASGTCGDNLTWQFFDNGTLEISGTGEMYDFNIFSSEDKEDYLPWREYRRQNQIKKVIVNQGVTSIGSGAFWGFTQYSLIPEVGSDSLISVELPSSLKKIGNSAFYSCSSLASITIPNSVTSIGRNAFCSCVFLSNVRLPDSLSVLDRRVFENCINLKTINFPSSLNEIGGETFHNTGFEYINIPSTVKYIGYGAFKYCNDLKEITINGDVNLQSDAFSYCKNLKKIVFKGKINGISELPSGNYNTDFDGDIFRDCPLLESAVIPSLFTYVDESYPIQSMYNFDGCDNLKLENISFNDDSKIVDGVLFSQDGKILLWYPEDLSDSSYDIPDGVQTLAYESFKNQQYLSHINIPDSVNNLKGRVFYNCSNLNNVIIPDGVTTLYDFQRCVSLKSIYIPDSVTTMYQNYKNSQETFENCTDLLIYCDKDSYAESFANQYSAFTAKEAVYCTFDADGGSVENNKQPVIPSDKYWKLPTSTRKDYTFNGWFTGKTSGTQVTKNTVVTNSTSHTLYAHWTYNSTTTPISNCTISLATTSYSFDGTAKKPSVTVKDGTTTLTNGTDYTVSYSNNTNAGTATATITGKGNYTGTASKTFTINAKSISSTSVTLGTTSYTYDGTAKKPSVTVKDGTTTLTNGTDYTVSYSNNTNTGTATVTITGKGNYSGTASKTFKINAKSISSTTVTLGTTSYTYDGTAKKPSVTVKDGSKTLTNGTDYTVSYSNNTNAGTATAIITGKSNYTGTVSKTFIINAKSLSSTTVTLGTISYTYDGTAKKPSVTVKDGSKTLANGTDYTVSYYNNTNAGTAKVTITGKGNYSGAVVKTFTILEPENKFTWGHDNWRFNNSSANFGSTYYINSKYYNKLMDGLNRLESKRISSALNRSWSGSCYGMAITSILGNQGILDPSEYKSNAKYVNDISAPPSSDVKSLINYYFAVQYTDQMNQKTLNAIGESESNKVKKLLSCLNDDSPTLFTYFWPPQYNPVTKTRYYSGHAVVAYDVLDETGKTSNGFSYNKKVLIYDNRLTGFSDNRCLYVNTNDYSWYIPYDGLSSTNGAVIGLTTDSIYDINYHGYIDGNNNVSIGEFISVLTTSDVASEIKWHKFTDSSSWFNYNAVDDDEILYFSPITDDTSGGYFNVGFKNSDSGYTMTIDAPQQQDISMRYENSLIEIKTSNTDSISFAPNGFVLIQGDKTNYNFELTYNDGYYYKDWYELSVSGMSVEKASITPRNDGYVLEASNLKDVVIRAGNDNCSPTVKFSSDYTKVLIYEIDENTIGLKVDTDNNGTYETELKTTMIGDVNGDSTVTVLDATMLQKYLAGLASFSNEQLAVADANGDGQVTVLDATAIQKYLANLVTSLG